MIRLLRSYCVFSALALLACSSGSRGKPEPNMLRNPSAPPSQTLYVSGYGSEIQVFAFDAQTGSLTPQSGVSGGISPSYLAFAPDRRHAYAVNEAEGDDSKVLAFSIAQPSGELTQLDAEATGGSGAPHLAVHPSGKWLAIAHYGSGHTSILPTKADGRLGEVVASNRGPNDDAEKAHQVVFDRSGKYLFVPCLGSDYVIQYKFDAGQLSYNDPPTVAVAGGPRHLAFDPAENYAYVLSEHDSTITSFKYDAASGKLSDPETIPSFERVKGASAHIVVHPSGKWLYVSNRAENSIGRFSIDGRGRPHPVDFETDMIATPRDFSLDPTGVWLISANQTGAENVLVFRIDPDGGRLTRTTVAAVGGQPTFTQALLLSP